MFDHPERVQVVDGETSWRRALDDEVRALRSLFDRVGVDAIASLRDEVVRLRAERDALATTLDGDASAGAVTPGTANARSRIETIAALGRAVVLDAAVPISPLLDAFASLVLRAYDAEAERALAVLRPEDLVSTVARLSRARDAIGALASAAGCSISVEYHRARIDELHAAATELAEHASRAQDVQREEQRRSLRAMRVSLLRERSQYERIYRMGDVHSAATAATKLTELTAALADVAAREQALGD